MRKALITVLVLALVSTMIYNVSFSSNDKEELIETQLNRLNEQYGENLFIAYYSIEELRSFSIIQLEKTMEMYNNEWITPENIVSRLNEEDKEVLNEMVIRRIASFSGDKDQQILQKLQMWCIAKSQFDLISSNMHFDRDELLVVIKGMDFASDVFRQVNKTGSAEINNLSETKKNEVFYSVMNKVAKLDFNDQLMFHSNLFAGLNKLNIN